MAPVFAAFDRDYYARILPHHLAEIQHFPATILSYLEKGNFAVNLTGQRWRAVALDEAHEMCINKDLKTAVVRPTKPYLQKTCLFFNCRIKLYKNLIQQLFPEQLVHQLQPSDILDRSPQAYKYEENIKHMCQLVKANSLICSDLQTGRELLNIFTGQLATNEQACDMLSFYQIGEQAFHNFVKYNILEVPSTPRAPMRQHKLLTMNTSKNRKVRSTPKEREQRQVITCLKRHLAWARHNKQPHTAAEEQFCELPRALSDEDGHPHKGSKSTWTDKLASRYQTTVPPVFTSFLPVTPEVVIIDAMFIINTRPLRRTNTFSDYVLFLFNQFVIQHFRKGALEVHLIFDKPDRQLFNPKQFEHKRRYSKTNKDHQHWPFTTSMNVPNNWQECLQCPQCKRSIVEAVGLACLQNGHHILTGNQRLILAGCFSGLGENTAWLLHPDEVAVEQLEEYSSNAVEADSRIWRHAMQSQASVILVYSPDTDVYNIGLPFVNH